MSRVAFRKNPRSFLFSVLLAYIGSGVWRGFFVTVVSLKICLGSLSFIAVTFFIAGSSIFVTLVSLMMTCFSRLVLSAVCWRDEARGNFFVSFLNPCFCLCFLPPDSGMTTASFCSLFGIKFCWRSSGVSFATFGACSFLTLATFSAGPLLFLCKTEYVVAPAASINTAATATFHHSILITLGFSLLYKTFLSKAIFSGCNFVC